MSRSKRRSLVALVAAAFAALTILIVANGALGILGQRRLTSDYENVVENVEELAQTVVIAQNSLLEVQYLLSLYAVSKESRLVNEGLTTIAVTRNLLDRILEMEGNTEFDGFSGIAEVRSILDSYGSAFEEFADLSEQIGLDDSGMQGELEASIRNLETLLENSGNDALLVGYLTLRRRESDFLASLDPQDVGRGAAAIEELRNRLALSSLSPTDRADGAAILDAYEAGFLRLSEGLMSRRSVQDDMTALANRMTGMLDGVVATARSFSRDTLEATRQEARRSMLIVLIVAAASLVISAVLGFLTARRLRRPTTAILAVTDAMAEGRLDVRAAMTRMDEMGRIGANVDRAAESIAGLLRSLKDAVRDGIELSDRLGAVAEETAAATTEVKANIDSIDRRTEDMDERARAAGKDVAEIVKRLQALSQAAADQSASVTQSTASVEEMVASIETVNGIAEERNRAAEKLGEVAETSRDSVRRTGESVDEISQLTENTLEVISVINAVASRTNLLAMNAAIEAAHAGDAGRGFAVVADEIRKLAESTGSNARRINDTLGAMVERIGAVKDAAAASIDAMETMAADVRGFTRSFAEISSSMGEMAVGSREVLNASETLARITEDMNRSVDEMAERAAAAGEAMTDLAELSGTVSGGIRETGRAGTEINQAAVGLASDGEANRSLMNRLRSAADRFSLGEDEGSSSAES